MVSSIGPFWDANETWLVLGVGILLVAFPRAHGVVLGALYLPVVAMLVGLMFRGVAFEFRMKALGWHRELWNWLFWAGSFLASFSQGFMLGRYITGFEPGVGFLLFATIVGAAVCGGYVLLGRDLARAQDRGRAAEEGARVVALGAALGGARRGAREPRDADGERDRAREVVRLPAHAGAHGAAGRVPLGGAHRLARHRPHAAGARARGTGSRSRARWRSSRSASWGSPTASSPTS